jgi:hypothetical protein
MEVLMEEYAAKDSASIKDVFGIHVSMEDKWFAQTGWDAFDSSQKSTTPDKDGARILLLLAYIMTTNVLDDTSNETQM